MGLRDELQKQLKDPSISEDELEDIKSEIISIQRQIYDIRSLSEDKLFDVSPTAFDWHKISIQIVRFRSLFQFIHSFIITVFLPQFGRSRTPDQLRLHWIHYLRPGVNISSWTAAENQMLKVKFVNRNINLAIRSINKYL